jgi:hypothetical protein
MLSRTATGLVAALALLAACDLFTGTGDRRVVGIIGVGEAGVFGSGGGGVAAAGAQDFPSRLDLPALEAPDTPDAHGHERPPRPSPPERRTTARARKMHQSPASLSRAGL